MVAEPKAFIPVQEPIGADEPLQVAAPKRRGRPPKDPNAEPTPKRGRKPRISIETRLGAFIIRCNMPLQIAATLGMIHADDPLTAPETEALAKSLAAQAQIHPTFRKYLETAIGVSDGADLIFVLGAIGLRRAANHGLVPEGIGTMASAALADPTALAAMFGEETAPEPKNVTPESEPDRSFEAIGMEP
jgi:hypothetical protein